MTSVTVQARNALVGTGLVLLSLAGLASPATAAPAAPKVRVGVALSSAAELPRYLNRVVKPDYLDLYVPWNRKAPFDTATADALQRRGVDYKVTWEPWDPAGPKTAQPAYALSKILAGRYDAYISRWAQGAAAFNHPVTVRLMHEANGDWYPWSPGVNGNTSTQYRAAWRHVVGLVRQQGATNVRWEWAPNQVYTGSTPLRPLWPGAAYVDSIGISAYNWGTGRRWHQWTEFKDLWPATIAQVRTFSSRPIGVAETGSVSTGGDQAAWMTNMFNDTRGLSYITYFDVKRPEADWRVEAAAPVLRAYRAGFARTR